MTCAETKETKTMKRLATLFASAVLCALALAPSAGAAEFGIVPGTAMGKTHAPTPLLTVAPPACGSGHVAAFQRHVDVAAIAATPVESQAGAHPDATGSGRLSGVTYSPCEGPFDGDNEVKDFIVDTPPGFLGNPTVVPPCERAAYAASMSESPSKQCQPASQVGVVTVWSNFNNPLSAPVYRLTASPGFPATFGFRYSTLLRVIINANVRTDKDYRLEAGSENILSTFPLQAVALTFWGSPADPVHDPERWNPHSGEPINTVGRTGDWGASSGQAVRPFIHTPADCNATELITTVKIDSWQEPGSFLPNASTPNPGDYSAAAPQPTGCGALRFAPSIMLLPSTSNSDSPTGVSVQMDVPQNEDPKGLATPPLKKAVVTLPAGMSVNPSAADGIEGCSPEQIGLITTTGEYPNPIRFAKGDDRCPQASKVGIGSVNTPLLDEPLEGDVFLATPYENPFDSLLALYLVFRGPGFVAKIPGKVEIDEQTNQLVSTFDYNPQVPFEKLSLDFFGGPRAPLATSPTCGIQPIESVLTPWSHPDSGPPAEPLNRYLADQGPAGAPCSTSLARRPFVPALTAGTSSPVAGGHSAFTMRLTRPDGHQELAGLTVKPPLGFTASLRNIPYCSDAALALAETRTGRWSTDHPDCPAASKLGTTLTGAGAGPTPLFTRGTAYLAGPYKGAPLSLAVITPALAGGAPGHEVFDLGTVLVRVALHINPKTAQITAIADPIPQTLRGIPLRIKDIRVELDRPQWGINPTSCAEKSFDVAASGQNGAGASLSSRFQVLECANLGFKPRLDLTLRGGTNRGGHPSLRAVVRPRPGDANFARAAVTLSRASFLDQSHIRTICTRVQFAAQNCPKAAIYGKTSAWSPLLDEPLTGPVYLRSSDNLLPDVVADLRGPARQPIKIELVGRVDSARGGIRTTFESIPDAQVEKFVLEMQGGRKGLIVNSRDLCERPSFANARLAAQNGRRHDFRPRVAAKGCEGNTSASARHKHKR